MARLVSSVDRRHLIAGAAGLPLPAAARPEWDAVVSKTGASGYQPTLGTALAQAALADPGFRILVEPGVYEEKLDVTVPGVTIVGRGPRSIVTFGAAAGMPSPDGSPWGTGRSATLSLRAPGVTLADLTIRNSFDFLANRRSGAVQGSQAVALLVDRGADRTTLRRCTVEGYQDTIYVQPRVLVDRCRVVGGTDFVFGGAAALFDRCTLVTRHVPGADPQGYVAAPSTPATQRFGLVFADCRLEREPGVPDRSAWLGRPWRAGGNMALAGQAAFLRCWMDAHIRREGWTAMGYRGPDGEQRMLTPPEARLYEWASRGPGAAPAGPDRRRLSAAEASAFMPRAILGDWRP